MEVKGQGWFCIDCEEDLFVEEGSLICTGIHQLGKYIRMLRATSVNFGKGNFQYGKGSKLEQILRNSTGIKGLHANFLYSIGVHMWLD